jgi:hypothetical protein
MSPAFSASSGRSVPLKENDEVCMIRRGYDNFPGERFFGTRLMTIEKEPET